MRLGTFAVAALLAVLGAGAVRADDPSEVPIVVGGRPQTVRGWSLDGAAAPTAPGDVLIVDNLFWPVTRGRDATPKFQGNIDSLYEEPGPDGVAHVVGVRLDPPRRRKGTSPSNDPSRGTAPEESGIPTLSDAEVAGLRSAIVRGWPDGAAAFLARVNPATTCVWIRDDLEKALPRLPEKLQYLFVTGSLPSDLSGLSRLTALRFLVLRGESEAPVDVRPLAGLAELRVLELAIGKIEHVEALAALHNLRQLSLAHCAPVTDLAWLRGCTSLRRLDVSHTTIGDLSPVGDLPALEVIDAHLAPVRVLPAGPCTSLRSLRLGSTVAAPEAVAAFRRLHPACELVPGRKGELLAAIGGVDRVRIRTGGTCHQDPENEVVCGELGTPEAIAEFLALLEVDDCDSGMRCMCCGSPTFEFHAGSKLLAAVSLHHDSHLRWNSKAWPGDVYLTEASRLALAAWLARHGEPEPMENIESSRRREAAERHREERQLALLGAERLAALRADLGDADGIAKYPDVLRRFEPDPDRRVLLALRLRGAAGDTWSEDVTYAVTDSLAAEPDEAVIRIGRAAPDDEARLGFALYLLRNGGVRGLSDAVLDDVVPPAARRLLADADPSIRGRAIDRLGEVKRPFAIDLLRRVLAGERFESKGAAGSTGAVGREGAAGATKEVETSHNVAAAASSLVELGDVASLPRIREVAAGLRDYRRRQLLEKIEKLEASEKAPIPK